MRLKAPSASLGIISNMAARKTSATLACVLLFGIARNHPFEQGNKRTELACALRFLENNGYTAILPNTEFLGEQLVAALTGALSEGDFGSMFASHVTEIEDT